MGKYSSSEMSIPFSFTINTYFFLQLLFLIQIQTYTVTSDEMYTSCAPFSCGNFTDLTYPFWSQNTQPNYCGHPKFKLHCHHGSLTLDIMSQRFIIISINQTSELLRIAREELYASTTSATIGSCPLHYIDVKVDLNFFHYTSSDENYTLLYECNLPDPQSSPLSSEIYEVTGCLIEGEPQRSYLVLKTRAVDFNVLKCKHNITVPGLKTSFTNQYNTLEEGFEVRWSGVDDKQICQDCKKSGGRCGYDVSTNKVMCISPKKAMTPTDGVTPSNGAWNSKTKLILGVASGVLATMVVLMIVVYLYRHQHNNAQAHIQSLNLSSSVQESQRIARYENHGRLQHFTYGDLELATEYFNQSNRLGDGAAGTVFKGKLTDHREVAVKKLSEHNPNTYELFSNEVQMLAELAHRNIVKIYGCTSGQSHRYLIVYEYVCNGTVYDHLHGDRAAAGRLTWNARMKIVVETASALTYLHAHNVIHRDIKPSNILLDTDYHAIVGDFGLSYDLPVDQSYVATRPEGTLGYLDPEYNHTHRLTLKSDVYSFGVVMIELITSLSAYDFTRPMGEAKLADMAMNRKQNNTFHELVDRTLGFDSDSKVQEMINRVADLAFRCLENSNERPSMDEVLISLQDIQSFGEPESVDISSLPDDVVLLNRDPSPLSPDSDSVSYYYST